MDDDQSNSVLHDGDIELIKNKVILIFFYTIWKRKIVLSQILFFLDGQKFSAKSQNLDIICGKANPCNFVNMQ